LGVLALALIFGLQRYMRKVPAALTAVVLASIYVAIVSPNIKLVKKIPRGLPHFTIPTGLPGHHAGADVLNLPFRFSSVCISWANIEKIVLHRRLPGRFRGVECIGIGRGQKAPALSRGLQPLPSSCRTTGRWTGPARAAEAKQASAVARGYGTTPR
jgi:hypothetical protein